MQELLLSDRFHWTQQEIRAMSNDFIEDALKYVSFESRVRRMNG